MTLQYCVKSQDSRAKGTARPLPLGLEKSPHSRGRICNSLLSSLPSVLSVHRGRGDFLSKSHLCCAKQPGLGWPSSAFKQRWTEILHVSQRPHLARAQAGEVGISVFPRVGWKSPAFDKVVKRVYKRDKEEAGSLRAPVAASVALKHSE